MKDRTEEELDLIAKEIHNTKISKFHSWLSRKHICLHCTVIIVFVALLGEILKLFSIPVYYFFIPCIFYCFIELLFIIALACRLMKNK